MPPLENRNALKGAAIAIAVCINPHFRVVAHLAEPDKLANLCESIGCCKLYCLYQLEAIYQSSPF